MISRENDVERCIIVDTLLIFRRSGREWPATDSPYVVVQLTMITDIDKWRKWRRMLCYSVLWLWNNWFDHLWLVRCPRVVKRGQIGLKLRCSSRIGQDELFGIQNSFLHQLEVLETDGIRGTIEKSQNLSLSRDPRNFFHFFSARPTKSTMLNIFIKKKVYVVISQEFTFFLSHSD